MRNALLYILFIMGLGCTPIDKLEPNQTDTFLKFYGETNEMNSKDLAVLDDGYLILSTYNDTTTLLLKTDMQGNQLWANSYNNFLGSSMAVLPNGYILIGDGINNQTNSAKTYMSLINTNSEGEVITTTQIGEGFHHGTAVTFSSTNEIIALGYIDSHDITLGDSIMLAAYDEDLNVRQWIRQYSMSISSKSIYETNTGNFTWLSYSNINGTINSLTLTEVAPDTQTPKNNDPLFDQNKFSNLDGDILKLPTGFAISQTISENGKSKIGVSISSDETISELDTESNYFAGSLTNTGSGLLIAATTDYHGEGSARTDKDLLLIETNYNGSLKTDGINATFGGVGDEVPVRIRRTNDGGFAVLGTLVNSKGAQQTFLLKTNNKGELN